MDLIVYPIIVLLVSWPFLLVGLLCTWILLRRKKALRPVKLLFWLVVVAIAVVLATLVVWRVWPEAFGGPMYFTYVHGPAATVNFILFASLFWWISRVQPNQGFNRTPVSSAAAKPVERSGGAG